MLRKLIWVPVVVLALLPTVSHAQFQQGDWDLTLSGSGFSDEDFDSTTLSAVGTIGKLFTDQLEGNIRQGISFADTSGGSSNFAGSTAVGVDFYFDMGHWQPFLGAAIGYRYGDGVDDDFFVTPEGGVKYFVNSTTYVFGSVGYQFGWDNEEDANLWVYQLGIGFRF